MILHGNWCSTKSCWHFKWLPHLHQNRDWIENLKYGIFVGETKVWIPAVRNRYASKFSSGELKCDDRALTILASVKTSRQLTFFLNFRFICDTNLPAYKGIQIMQTMLFIIEWQDHLLRLFKDASSLRLLNTHMTF